MQDYYITFQQGIKIAPKTKIPYLEPRIKSLISKTLTFISMTNLRQLFRATAGLALLIFFAFPADAQRKNRQSVGNFTIDSVLYNNLKYRHIGPVSRRTFGGSGRHSRQSALFCDGHDRGRSLAHRRCRKFVAKHF